MANWEDIINNRLTMGRSRWLYYGLNEERRRQEQEEREGRPGVRPVGNGWGNIQMENFYEYRILGRGTLRPRPFIQIHWGLVHPRPLQGAAVGFGRVVHGPREDHVRWHLPGPWEMGPAGQGMGVNPQRPHFVGPQLYQPPLPASIPEENVEDISAELLNAGEDSP